MKIYSSIQLAFLFFIGGIGFLRSAPVAESQPATTSVKEAPSSIAYSVVGRDANSRVIEWTVNEPSPFGQSVPKRHSYTEMATGMHYQKDGQWVDSKEWIDILPNGTAQAIQGQHQAYFPADIYSGIIELVTPDGQHLKSQPMGLSYYDGNNSVLIAELKSSEGMVVGDNQVIYFDAFTDIKADLVYTYTKGGFEQDVVLHQQPPTPESFNLDPSKARLEVLTEFFSPPQPTVKSRQLSEQAGLALTDESLGFGSMQMVPGRAFLLGQSARDAGASVSKQWMLMDGRQFLVEAVPVDAIVEGLAKLPLTAMGSGSRKPSHTASRHLVLPPQRQVKNTSKTMMMARAELPTQGFVLDYQTLNSSLTNYTFQSDTTYYISGTVTLFQTNTFEGGTVLKYATNASVTLSSGAVNWKAGSYRPVVFTSKDDNAVGETISGSTGNPINYFANPALAFSSLSMSPDIANLRISFAKQAISLQGTGYGVNFYDGQIYNCLNGVTCNGGDTFNLKNCLFAVVKTNFNSLSSSSFNVQNSSFDSSSNLALIVASTGQYVYLSFTNCIFANILNLTNGYAYPSNGTFQVTAGNNGFYKTPTIGSTTITNSGNPFWIMGCGKYYLTNSCSFLDAGTSNIDSTTLADIRSRTTYPPTIYSNLTISIVTNFSPQASRDTNQPDLGYHYDPLDYVFGGVKAYSNMTFTAGTAIGYFELPGSGGPGYGISLYDKAILSLNGTVTQPCVVARYSTVQEGGTGLWKDRGYLAAIIAQSLSGGYSMNATNAAQVRPTFTHHFALTGDPNHYREYNALIKVAANNSEFVSASIGAYWVYLNFTNCLFDRTSFGVYGGNWAICSMRNCTMRGGGVTLQKYSQTWPVWIEDCAFDRTTLAVDDNSGGNTNISYCDFNAFVTNQNRLPGAGAHDVLVTNFNWQSSWLGYFYQPTNSTLINAGSPTANLIGLYHFTTQTNQVKETNSIVDIGYHYVAVDGTANPIDFNGDGILDYIEDANGNGVVDGGETGWTNMDIDGDGIPNSWELSHGLNPFSATDALLDLDYDGRNNLQEYQDGTDTLNPNSVLQVRLGYWLFDTNTWVGNAGQLPLVATNIYGIPSWNTNAALIDATNGDVLKYRDVETNGYANINLHTGTIRFWFKPDWSSTNAGVSGPQSEGRFIEMGTKSSTNGWWSLLVNSSGTNIYFGTQTNSTGTLTTNLIAPINWTSNFWHQVVLTYGMSNSSLYVDGLPVITNGLGVVVYPGPTIRAQGFTIGGSASGTNQARGQFDDLETFNYRLDATSILANYDSDGDGLPDVWEWNYFHSFAYSGTNLDAFGNTFQSDYQNHTDPNVIQFVFSVPSQYVSTNIVSGSISILGGVPANIAVLVDSTNFASATWTAYTSSNITINLGLAQGAHNVWVGLRGFPADGQQTWQETTLVLDTNAPAISITSPANNASFNASRVNVSGSFTAPSIRGITVNDVSAFINGTNYEAVNVPLGAGTNAIVAVVESWTGLTNTATINVVVMTNTDGSLNDPVQLTATPVAGFAPLSVDFQAESAAPGTLVHAFYDFNGDNLADLTAADLAAVTHIYTNSGEYFPIVTLQTSVARFSSVGGWNAYDPNAIRINVQSGPEIVLSIPITDPVDVKWSGTNLYVLSGSTATITEFDANTNIIRTLASVGSNPSGLDVDSAGNVYVARTGNNKVGKFNPTTSSFVADAGFGTGGSIGLADGTTGTDPGAFNAPFDVAISPDGGTISVSDSGNHRIQQFSAANGAFIDTFGAYGGDVGQFHTPKGLTYDSVGTSYVVDSGNNRIVVAGSSTVFSASGSVGTGLGQFSGPVNISVGERGVYVADTGNNRIQKFDAPNHGLFNITPASVRFGFSTNFSQPHSVTAVHNFTNELFYVADTGNNRVVLCRAPNNDANAILEVWDRMVSYVNAGDFNGAATCFSVVSADRYHQAYLSVGTTTTISAINQIGTLTPAVIYGDTAQYYFEKIIDGQTITFPVEFVKENGMWEISQF